MTMTYLIYFAVLGVFIVVCMIADKLEKIIELLKNPPKP